MLPRLRKDVPKANSSVAMEGGLVVVHGCNIAANPLPSMAKTHFLANLFLAVLPIRLDDSVFFGQPPSPSVCIIPQQDR